jgi:hypothetical protein
MSENISIKTIYDANNDKENTLTFEGSVSRSGNTITGVDTNTDTNTTYKAGTGMVLDTGNSFRCTVVNTDTNTTYTGGSGITLSGTSFSCSTNYAGPNGNSGNNWNCNKLSMEDYLKIRGWYIGEGMSVGTRDGAHSYDLVFSRTVNVSGEPQNNGFHWISYTESGSDRLDFTGQHNLITEKKFMKNQIGYIVSSSGKYKDINSKYKNNIFNIKINQSLPYCILSSHINDKRCIGVISDIDENDSKYRVYQQNMLNYSQIKNINDNRIVINSLGEGAIWVSNYNGALENGDYITTSIIQGIGMKQSDDILHNYSVAKITQDCDFNPKYEPILKLKEEFIYSSNYDENSNVIITSNLTICIDDYGNSIYINEYNEDNTIKYTYDYEIKYINNLGDIINKLEYDKDNHYIMAFDGCTYHCG